MFVGGEAQVVLIPLPFSPGVDLQVEAPEAPRVDPLVAKTRPLEQIAWKKP